MSDQWGVVRLDVAAKIGEVPTATAVLARTPGDLAEDPLSTITLTIAQGETVPELDAVLQYRERVCRVVDACVQALNKLPVKVQG
ncbi:MAG: hypothetical protein A2843_02730 [Candidatus Wildermuthbacteria bacterium RIFCSPHIGHO2_01_FULL_48_27b]|uniref:Uncharacterized protein n=1 Tax=Candidatus Wildermuthbacteria bacterium RIFCSPHIGHO2_01_FULL_48_27b TaxID=1802447 RepID=A0A1G2QT39_9BACT|nr:MAG: hypothetical protein A2843_02730 [Candidatus Wildermuthbacteria bacterium RIFCSPHIGHO2_01_FULL_48_27b]